MEPTPDSRPTSRTRVHLGLALAALLAAAGFAAVAAGAIGPRGVRFVAEEVTLRASPGARPLLEIDGRYRLRNGGRLPLLLPIRFPYPSAPEVLQTEVLAVEVEGAPLPFSAGEGEVRFGVPLGARADALLRVRYRQWLPAGRARYVVLTTRDWGRPLEEARFRVMLPSGCALTEAAPPLDLRTGEGAARPFWPEADLAFAWSCAPRPSE